MYTYTNIKCILIDFIEMDTHNCVKVHFYTFYTIRRMGEYSDQLFNSIDRSENKLLKNKTIKTQ